MEYTEEIKNKISNFYDILITNLKHCDLKLFHKNIKTLKITNFDMPKDSPNCSLYFIKSNRIMINNEDDLGHELMHVASSYYDGIDISGFSIGKSGDGLNEGYTELLSKRYLDVKRTSYPIEMKIAFNIEQIVTKKLMEQLYFKADLKGLINELSKYSSKQQVVDLINSIDYINKRVNYDRTKSNHERFIIHKVKEINLFLLNCYINKLTIEFKNNQISLNEFYENLKNYSKNLKYVMNPFEEKYCILTYRNIDDSIKKHIKLLHI